MSDIPEESNSDNRLSEDDRYLLELAQTREQTARDEWEEKKDLERYAMRLEASARSWKRITALLLLVLLIQEITILTLVLR